MWFSHWMRSKLSVDAVLVWKLGSRSLRDNLDLTTPAGRLMFQVIGAMAEFEQALVQEREGRAAERTCEGEAPGSASHIDTGGEGRAATCSGAQRFPNGWEFRRRPCCGRRSGKASRSDGIEI
jgi:hypothetical protein